MSFSRTNRSDGRVELKCDHGVGHPSEKLTWKHSHSWQETDGVHTCCGCCDSLEFFQAENEELQKE